MGSIELEPWIEKLVPLNLVDYFKTLRKEQLTMQKRLINIFKNLM